MSVDKSRISLPLMRRLVYRVAYVEFGSFENANAIKTWFDNKCVVCLVWRYDDETSTVQ